jgi:hypothetical protein
MDNYTPIMPVPSDAPKLSNKNELVIHYNRPSAKGFFVL